jgi:hypothetical protein
MADPRPSSRSARTPLHDVNDEDALVARRHALDDLRNVADVLAAGEEKFEARQTPPSPPTLTVVGAS